MIFTCNACQTKYNIDERKIPDQGVKAKCTKCGAVLFIVKPGVTPEIEKPVEPKPEVVEPTPKVTEPKPEPKVVVPKPKIIEPPKVERPFTKPAEKGLEGLSEEDKRWHERARRLAKVLASDLVLYHKDKVERGLKDGSLAKLLGSEIRRSWEYYCQQIPKHIVDSTNYFKDALNRIVGKGRELFR